MKDLLAFLKEYNSTLWLVMVILGVFFEITPTKINPISWLGSVFNRNTNNKIETMNNKFQILDNKIADLNVKIDKNQVEYLKLHILDFANSIQNGRERGKEEYHNVMGMYGRYHQIVGENNFPNNVLEESYKIIKESYHEKMMHNSFISERGK